MSKDPHQILVRPLLTEKGTTMKEDLNKICFLVSKDANKIEIKQAAEEVLKVKIDTVHTVNLRGKKKRMGRFEGRLPSRKKAILTLKKGEKLELFEGA